MSLETPQVDRVGAAVALAYRAAGLEPGGGLGAVTPLRQLIQYQELFVDEVSDLSRRTAAAHFEALTGRALLDAAGADERLAGFLLANRKGGWILVNRDDPVERRRFSIAHELGHYLLHFLPLRASGGEGAAELEFDEGLPPAADDTVGAGRVVVRQADAGAWGTGEATMEDEADRFAAAVLMPATVCARLVAEHGPRCGGKRAVLVRRLASELLVSQAALRRRLTDLGLGNEYDA